MLLVELDHNAMEQKTRHEEAGDDALVELVNEAEVVIHYDDANDVAVVLDDVNL